ncbi:chemotaxis protein CheA [Brevundimonas goettingensis]|uniref:Chemotaxis protein CheA n=1 Tax=Brevundimonas goettingensis TaxID=2774190 RepID=A0A975GWR4_9CAUL|nr:chemotaxis protein CheA [Brevundimonas goettingensis]QTC92892.1 chemotaxis protein CheA [Brevundimonas goettingensis]
MDELLEQFLIEGPELAQRAGQDLLALERTPDDPALIDSAFRAVHTLKGSVGLFDLAPMGRVLHSAEDVLDAVRKKRLTATGDLVDVLLAVVDRSETWLEDLGRDGELGSDAGVAADRLVARLSDFLGRTDEDRTTSAAPDVRWVGALRLRHPDAQGRLTAVRYRPDAQAFFRGDDPLAIVRTVPGLRALEVSAGPVDPSADYDPFVCRLAFDLLSEADPDRVAEAFRLVKDQADIILSTDHETAESAPAAVPVDRTSLAATRLRVDGRQVDALADQADQLVIAKNALLALADPDGELARIQALIDRLTTDLHSGVMRLRMTPLSPVLRRLERQARQLAAELGKSVDIEFRGHGVEADKGVVDGLYEPLLHLVRNALDHGVEDTAERHGAGKGERAILSVRARVDGDEVEVEVRDDGRGMDPAHLREIARARGLGDRIDLDGLSEQAALELIFTPGFSTASRVSSVSGRGVGMDAVREAVTGLGGRIAIASLPGRGSVLTLRAPLTVVMTRVLIVEVGGERFGLLLSDVQQTLRIRAEEITPVRLGSAIVVRETVLPFVRLADLVRPGVPAPFDSGLTVLIVEGAEGRLALGVDAVGARLDVVLKPLSGLLAAVPGATGTTLLGDGKLLLVLDLKALVR